MKGSRRRICPDFTANVLNPQAATAVLMGMVPDLKLTCRDALTEAASEVAATVLGGMPFAVVAGANAETASEPAPAHGAYVGLVAREEPIQVGLLAEPAGCQLLAKALLGMDAADEDLPSSDVSDAMCEIINIVAGGLKRRVAGSLSVTLGLPIFVAGPPLPNQQQEIVAQELQLGSVAVRLLILTQKEHSAPLSRSAAQTRAVEERS